MGSRIVRAAAVFVATATIVVWLAAPAGAHVTASVDGAQPGEYGLITLRVPTESDTANTTRVEARVPDDVHLASVLVEPQPGWRVEVTTTKIPPVSHHGAQITEAVNAITWTATGDGIPPGGFGRFVLLAGPLPDTAAFSLPTVQTYSDGSAVAWTQQASGGAEPERPAPTVTLAKAEASAIPSSSGGDVIAWTALGLAIVAVALGGFAAVRVARARPAGVTDAE